MYIIYAKYLHLHLKSRHVFRYVHISAENKGNCV